MFHNLRVHVTRCSASCVNWALHSWTQTGFVKTATESLCHFLAQPYFPHSVLTDDFFSGNCSLCASLKEWSLHYSFFQVICFEFFLFSFATERIPTEITCHFDELIWHRVQIVLNDHPLVAVQQEPGKENKQDLRNLRKSRNWCESRKIKKLV